MVERARRPGAAFIAHRPSERAPQVGDLICASRAGSGTTLDNLNRGAGHCDIVVEVKPGWVAAIGGNVADLVSRSVFPLDGNGFLSPISGPARFRRDRKQIAVGSLGRTRMSWPYDYIIIGAGSAGCAIANRLAEDMALRILIIEAGPPDTSFKLKMPAGFASLGENSPYNWRYETVPQKHCNDRRMFWPRGKVLGGSKQLERDDSHPRAPLQLRRLAGTQEIPAGDTTTSCPTSSAPRPWCGAPSPYHGTGGPIYVCDVGPCAPAAAVFVDAATSCCGIARNDDFNGAEARGAGRYQVPGAKGRAGARPAPICGPRSSSTAPSSHPRPRRSAIMMVEGRPAGGATGGRRSTRPLLPPRGPPVRRRGAVAAPAADVRHRPRRDLTAGGVPVVHPLPGVGANLQDHLDVCLSWGVPAAGITLYSLRKGLDQNPRRRPSTPTCCSARDWAARSSSKSGAFLRSTPPDLDRAGPADPQRTVPGHPCRTTARCR